MVALTMALPVPRQQTVRTRARQPVMAKAMASADAGRRNVLSGLLLASASVMVAPDAWAASSLPVEDETEIKLCDAACEAALERTPMVTLPSGLQYKEIVVGKGASPPVGFQATVQYVAMIPTGQIFFSSLAAGKPLDVRAGTDNVIPGFSEGLLTMKAGGLRRLYIPGKLAFPKGLASAPGRPRVLPNADVIFDVKLLFVPGFEIDE